jgi:type II secretory pathway pseudopilin PulG
VEIMLVVAIIGLLAAMALPSWHRARENAQLQSIANNLRLLEGAKAQWALENKKATADAVTTGDLMPYMKTNPLKPVTGESYAIGGLGTVGDLVEATLAGGSVLLGKAGPFTTTSF